MMGSKRKPAFSLKSWRTENAGSSLTYRGPFYHVADRKFFDFPKFRHDRSQQEGVMAGALLKLNALEQFDKVHKNAHGTVLIMSPGRLKKRLDRVRRYLRPCHLRSS
jgi:hypothetical protein